jgi:hypothetical protein
MLDTRTVDETLARVDELFADSRLSVDTGKTYQQLLGFSESPSKCELAESLAGARVPFRVTLRIAPLTGDRLPSAAEFIPVLGHDLSLGGVAFLVKTRPDCQSLALALNTSSTVDYLEARVVHCTEVLFNRSGLVRRAGQEEAAAGSPDESAEPMILVGCEFVRRLPGEKISPNLEDSDDAQG